MKDTPLPSPPPQGGREQTEVAAPPQSLTTRARALYEDTVVPVREIARLTGVTERTILKYARKGDWKPPVRGIAAGGRTRPLRRSRARARVSSGARMPARHFRSD